MSITTRKCLLLVPCLSLLVSGVSARPDEQDRNICEAQPTDYNKHTIGSVPRADYACCLCPAGKFYSEPCKEGFMNTTECLQCEFIDDDIDHQFFMPLSPHSEQKCFKAKGECKSTEYRIQGNRTANAQCNERTKCESGFGVAQFATPTSDTICSKCYEGYESPTLSATEKCTKIKIVTTIKPDLPPTSVVATTKVSTTTLQTTFTPFKSSGAISPGGIVGIVLAIVVLVILLSLGMWRLRHTLCQKAADDRRNGGEEGIPMKYLPPQRVSTAGGQNVPPGGPIANGHNVSNGDSHSQPQRVDMPPSSPSLNNPDQAPREPPATHTPQSPSQSSQGQGEQEHLLPQQTDGNDSQHQPSQVDDTEQAGSLHGHLAKSDPLYAEKMEAIRYYLDEAITEKDSIFRMFRHFKSNDEQFLSNANNNCKTISEFFNACHRKLRVYGHQRYNPEAVIKYFRSTDEMLHVYKIESRMKEIENKTTLQN